jgi:hypothetical protein
MRFDNYVTWLDTPMNRLDLNRAFPRRPPNKRREAFALISDGMTVRQWREEIAKRPHLTKVDFSFLRHYEKANHHRVPPTLIKLAKPQPPQA